MSSKYSPGRDILFTSVQNDPGAHPAPIQWVLRSSPDEQRKEHVVDRLTLIQCRGARRRTTTPLLSIWALMVCHGAKFTGYAEQRLYWNSAHVGRKLLFTVRIVPSSTGILASLVTRDTWRWYYTTSEPQVTRNSALNTRDSDALLHYPYECSISFLLNVWMHGQSEGLHIYIRDILLYTCWAML